MARAPKITINIGADTRRLKGDLNKADGIVGRFTKAASGAMMGLGVAAAGAAVAIGVEGVQAAIADQKEQVSLAKTLKNTTAATDVQVKSVEDYIEKTMFATGVTDTKLRKSFDRLVRSTRDTTKAQKLQAIALDVAAGSGKDLQAVSDAISKAYDGNYTALNKLGGGIDQSIIKAKDFDGAMGALSKTFEGQADAAANTMDGRMRRLTIRFDEAKESIGYALTEGLEPLFDFMDSEEGKKFMDDFVVVFADSMKVVAQVLPGIVREIGKVVSSVAKVGLAQTLFDDPKLTIAAMAYGAGFAVGGPMGGALAAIAAYQVSGKIEQHDRPKDKAAAARRLMLAQKGFDPNGVEFQGSFSDYFYRGSGLNRSMLGEGSNINRGGYTGQYFAGGGQRQNVTINVNALSPAEAARAVQQAFNKANRMGVSRLSGAAG